MEVVDTLEDNQNTNTQETEVVQEEVTTPVEEPTDSSTPNIDAMTDDEFIAFMNEDLIKSTDTKKESTTNEVEDKKLEVEVKDEQTPVKDVKQESTVKEDTNSSTTTIPENYADIFKPFKANGKEIVPKTVEDVISLMQMGANYTKKMQLMAPMKKTVESLNRAEIKEEDLNFLIDIHKGDKEAIKKLLEKHKVDPLELDMDNTNYVAKDNMVSESDVEYVSVLDDIQSSLPKITEIISSKWDDKSKQALLKDPRLLRGLHEEIELGRFDKVQSQLEIERTFGRYKGMSDVEAYIDIVSKESKVNNTTNVVSKIPTAETAPVTKSFDKSKAAPIKGTPSNKGTALSMDELVNSSDEQFLKLINNGVV